MHGIMYAHGKQQMLRILSTCINLSSFNTRGGAYIRTTVIGEMHVICSISHSMSCDLGNIHHRTLTTILYVVYIATMIEDDFLSNVAG